MSKRSISPFLALQFLPFRFFLLGTFISEIGNQMQTVAVAWQVYELTHNPASLGLIGLANFLPLILFSLLGGLAADLSNRKRLIIFGQLLSAVSTIYLFSATQSKFVSPIWIYLVLFFDSTVGSFYRPARQSVLPHLVDRKYFMNAVSLNTLQYQVATLIGPAIAGFLIAQFNVQVVYLVNATTFLFFMLCILPIKVPLADKKRTASFSHHSIWEGVKFVMTTPILYTTMVLDFLATFFGTATILMPVFAKDVLHVGAKGLGILYSAPAIGAIVAGLILSSIHNLKHQGKIIVISVLIYGLATIGFGLSKVLLLSVVFLMISGAGDMVSSIIRNTVRQMITPDHLRGRMVSIMRIFFMGGPQLGEIEAGFLAKAVGGPVSVAVGGIGTIITTLVIAKISPQLRKYQGKELAV